MKDIMNFIYYMFNKWTYEESVRLFGLTLGKHIHMKRSGEKDTLRWFAELDQDSREKILKRANELYGK